MARATNTPAAALLIAAAALAPASSLAAGVAPDLQARIEAVAPDLERYVEAGMTAFDVPGAVVGIVAGDRLVYSHGFGVRRKGGTVPVDAKTLFQIGSTTKAFIAATLAIAVDRGKLKWEDRVVELDPSFALKDPYVTREFRVYDLLAQRSGLPPQANSVLSLLGFDADWLMHSLRFVEPRTSFRSTFTYTNITHLFAGRIVAQALGAADWPTLVQREIVTPLGMQDTSFSAEAIANAPDHASGHRWSAKGSVEIQFDPIFPYVFGPAGDINSTLEDCALWLRLQMHDGVFDARRLISERNLAITRTPKVAISEAVSYAMGWLIQDTPNGRIVWHDGGTNGFGAEIGFLPKKNVGVIVLSNAENKGFPDAVGLWTFDRLLGNPEIDYVKDALALATAEAAREEEIYQRRGVPRPPPDLTAVAGEYESDELGPAEIRPEADGLVALLQETGARLRLEPFDGAVFTVRVVPEGRFAAGVASLPDLPVGFADFESGPAGKLMQLRWTPMGQTYLWRKRAERSGAE